MTGPAERLRADLARAEVRLEALERDRAAIVTASADSNADDEHDPEGATIAFERQQVVALIDQTLVARDDLQAALRRVADGTYGRCEACGGPIGDARLDARPAARTCIDCAAAH